MQDGGGKQLSHAEKVALSIKNKQSTMPDIPQNDGFISSVAGSMEKVVSSYIDYGKGVLKAVGEPGKQIKESFSKFGSGDVAGGLSSLLNAGVSTVGAILSPISVGAEMFSNSLPENVRNLGLSKGLADTINYDVSQPASAFASATDALINKLPDSVPLTVNGNTVFVTKDEFRNLGISQETVDAINPALRSVGDLAAQTLLAKKIEMARTPEFKPLVEGLKPPQTSIEPRDGTFSQKATFDIAQGENVQSTLPKIDFSPAYKNLDTGEIIKGAKSDTHYDVAHAYAEQSAPNPQPSTVTNSVKGMEKGYVDNTGKFYTPKQADESLSAQVKATINVDKSQMDVPQQITTTVEQNKLQNQLEKFLNKLGLSPDAKKQVYDIVDKVEARFGKKFTSSNLTYVRRLALDKGTELTHLYGQYGGTGYNIGMRGNSEWTRLMANGYSALEPLHEIQSKVGKWTYGDSYAKVVEASQDRANAPTILGDDIIAQEIYPHVINFLDNMKKEIEARGIKTENDYYMRIEQQKTVDEFLSTTKDIEKVNQNAIQEHLTANSDRLKERVKDNAGKIRKDVFALYSYLHSVSRQLAYKDYMDYMSTDFVKGVRSNKLLNQDLKYARQSIKGLLDPEKAYSPTWQAVEKTKANLYTAFLYNNIKLSLQNSMQKEVGKMFVTPEAEVLTNQVFNHKYQPTGRLLDAITETKNETGAYIGEGTNIWRKGNLTNFLEKSDLFRMSENGNWRWSETGGIINTVTRETGAKTFDEISNALNDQKLFDKAVAEGRDLAARTQVSPEAAFRPVLYDQPLMRLILMFTRYPLQMSDLFIKTVIKSMEGTDGLRAQSILRRGMTNAAEPVEMLRSTEYLRKNLEFALKSANKEKYDLGVSKQVINSYIDMFKSKEKDLNNIIKGQEPITKLRASKKWGKYLGSTAMIGLAYRLLENELWNAVGLNKNQRKKSIGQHLTNSLIDAIPLPIMRMTSGRALSPPILPDWRLFAFGKVNVKEGTQGMIDWGANLVPGLGVGAQFFRDVTGTTLGKIISTGIFGVGGTTKYNFRGMRSRR